MGDDVDDDGGGNDGEDDGGSEAGALRASDSGWQWQNSATGTRREVDVACVEERAVAMLTECKDGDDKEALDAAVNAELDKAVVLQNLLEAFSGDAPA